jgi:hypothetical protein
MLSRVPAVVRAHRALFEAVLTRRDARVDSAPVVWRAASALIDAFGDGARPTLLRAYLGAKGERADELLVVILERNVLGTD